MRRRSFLKKVALAATVPYLPLSLKPQQKNPLWKENKESKKVLVLQATPGGIATAIGAAQMGMEVLILERSKHIGGLPANGLGATDIMSHGATAGLFMEFTDRILSYYVNKYGKDSLQVKVCKEGYHFEPSVAEQVFWEMLKEQPKIKVLTMRQFNHDKKEQLVLENGRIKSIKIWNRIGNKEEVYEADVFIDASYEGDLMASAGEPFRLGRESYSEFKEPNAGTHYEYWVGPKLEEYNTGLADNAIQAYNYRLCLTKDPKDITPIEKPKNYRREDYVSLIKDVKTMATADYRVASQHLEKKLKAIKERFETGEKMRYWQYTAGMNSVVNIVDLPNGKSDANNHHAALLSTDLPEENWPWPSSSWNWRDRYAKRLRDYTLGLLWFCQNDEDLPEWFRKDCQEWGLSKSEYKDNNNFPRQVYVREGRRMEGSYFFTAHDVLSKNDERPKIHQDTITSSHYALDSHVCRKRDVTMPLLEGQFSLQVKPYTVPFQVMLPKNTKNLICPVPVSATHVGFATLRMEPCWLALGQAAGVAAAQMIANNKANDSLDFPKIQKELVGQKAKLVHFLDFPTDHKHYETVQLLATKGKLTEWELKPDEKIDPMTAKDWCKRHGINYIEPKKETRAEYLTNIYEAL